MSALIQASYSTNGKATDRIHFGYAGRSVRFRVSTTITPEDRHPHYKIPLDLLLREEEGGQ